MKYSFIIPIYNRPDELDELLNSLVSQTYEDTFEVVVIEDGSSIPSKEVCEKYKNDLSNLSFYTLIIFWIFLAKIIPK